MHLICGIDEAGRGCVAGSMFVAGVLAHERDLQNLNIKDSKKLSQKRRFEIAQILKNMAQNEQIYFHITQSSARQIDELGISACIKNSLEEIMRVLAIKFQNPNSEKLFIFDGNSKFGAKTQFTLQTLVKGDDKVLQIAAASILAKAAKDEQMIAISEQFPAYNFAQNKGYGTQKHIKAILEFGICPAHRKSFLKKIINDVENTTNALF